MLRLFRDRLHRSLQSKSTAHRFSSARREPIEGQASPEGTKRFVAKSKLPLYHRFIRSNLLINPIIHGPPLTKLAKVVETQTEGQDACTEYLTKAVCEHHCNAIFVFDNETQWAFKGLDKLLKMKTKPPPEFVVSPTAVGPAGQPSPAMAGPVLKRDSLVLFADLGSPENEMDLRNRLTKAKTMCNVTNIDFVMLNYSASGLTMRGSQATDMFEILDRLCTSEEILGYGLTIHVAPYNFHTPAYRQNGPYMMIPPQFEQILTSESKFADLMAYPISPSTHIPATYMMLDSSAPQKDDSIFAQQTDNGKEIPFVDEENRKLSRAALHPFICKKGTGINDEEKANSIAMKENMLISKISAEVDHIQAPGKEGETSSNDVGTSKTDLIDAHSALTNLIEEELKSSLFGLKTDMYLISGTNKKAVEVMIREQLDSCCPLLGTTPRLQDKALRCVFSVGIDCAIVDAESSAKMGRLQLRQKDIIDHKHTENVFGKFSVNDYISS